MAGQHSDNCGRHCAGEGKDGEGDWESAESAAYPPELNLYLARSIVDLHSSRPRVTVPEPQASASKTHDDDEKRTVLKS